VLSAPSLIAYIGLPTILCVQIRRRLCHQYRKKLLSPTDMPMAIFHVDGDHVQIRFFFNLPIIHLFFSLFKQIYSGIRAGASEIGANGPGFGRSGGRAQRRAQRVSRGEHVLNSQ